MFSPTIDNRLRAIDYSSNCREKIIMIFFRIFQAVIVGAERQHPVILPVGHRSHHIMGFGQQLVHPGIFQAADTLCKTLHGVLILALLPISLRQIIESKPCQLL